MLRTALCVATAAFIACGSEDPDTHTASAPTLAPTEYVPVPGCEHIEHDPCDIRDEECQRSRLDLAACLRGTDAGELPPITLMNEEELAEYLASGQPAAAAPEVDHFAAALSLLRIAEPEDLQAESMLAEAVQWLNGLYRSDTKDIVIVDHGEPSDHIDANLTLVHEFVHALQDRDVDLAAYHEEYGFDVDSSLADRSIPEGEARLHDSRYRSSLLGLDPSAIDWARHFDGVVSRNLEFALEEPSPYARSFFIVPYVYGARFVHRAWAAGGTEAVFELFASPPRFTQALLAEPDAVVQALPPVEFVAPVPTGYVWTFSSEATLGAWGVALVMGKIAGVEGATRLAPAWRGDRLYMYETAGDGRSTAAVWLLEVSDEDACNRALVYLREEFGDDAAQKNGATRVVLAVSELVFGSLTWAF